MTLAATSAVRVRAGGRASKIQLWLLVLAVSAVLCTPIICLAFTSLNTQAIGQSVRLGLANWRQVVSQPALFDALVNTVSLAIASQSLALVVGAGVAWLIARTDLPGRRWMEVGFWIALFMPPLQAALAWVLLLDGSTGLINKALYALPFVHAPVFKIYSWWGIVWVHLMGSSLAVKIFLLVPAFKALDSSLEEAARVSGASLVKTFTRIVLPLMAPVLIVTALLGVIRSMQAFEVELVLGAPAGINVYSTAIYRTMTQEPPDQGLASALSIAFLLAMTPLVLIQQWQSRGGGHAFLTGKTRRRLQPLGAWKWPVFAMISVLLVLMTLVPLVCLMTSTFMRLFGISDMRDPWTLDNWRDALGQGDVLRSIWNTLELGLLAAAWGMLVFTVLAYVIVRSRSRLARVLDFLTWLPALVPGVVLSLGLLQMFLNVPVFRLLYGHISGMVLAVLLGTATVGVQFLKTSIGQLGAELEEAGAICGGSRLLVLRRIVLPLIAPSIAVVGLETFAVANAAVGVVALLGVGAMQPLSIFQLNLLNSGQLEAASVVGFTIMTLTVGSAFLARWLADRAGLEASA